MAKNNQLKELIAEMGKLHQEGFNDIMELQALLFAVMHAIQNVIKIDPEIGLRRYGNHIVYSLYQSDVTNLSWYIVLSYVDPYHMDEMFYDVLQLVALRDELTEVFPRPTTCPCCDQPGCDSSCTGL